MTRSTVSAGGAGSSVASGVMNSYNKPYLETNQLLDLLESRGISLSDRAEGASDLRRLGYYRLSAYWYPFRQRLPGHTEGKDIPGDNVIGGYALKDFVDLCDFDAVLRNIILAAIEPFETSTRALVADQVGRRGAFTYIDKAYWGTAADIAAKGNSGLTQYEFFCQKQSDQLLGSKETFATHFRKRYAGPLPIWAAVELWDFGMLSRFYEIMAPDDRHAIATRYGLTAASTFQGWLVSLNDLRNFCAHHSRLNRRHFPNLPRIPGNIPAFRDIRRVQDRDPHRLYSLLCVLAYVLLQLNRPNHWQAVVVQHFTIPPASSCFHLKDYGIPQNWLHSPLWSTGK
ncbi:MAG: Abi family protein [Thermomicrobiales bacterium]|nr:Abi family protein [Thermomicrobiales bacterium]MCO5222818.1 Abi family protein [Thermomicrobiales bacterium]